VIARLEAADARTVKTGDAIPVAALARSVHLFDASTGTTL
jgi:hypothetical protein